MKIQFFFCFESKLNESFNDSIIYLCNITYFLKNISTKPFVIEFQQLTDEE